MRVISPAEAEALAIVSCRGDMHGATKNGWTERCAHPSTSEAARMLAGCDVNWVLSVVVVGMSVNHWWIGRKQLETRENADKT